LLAEHETKRLDLTPWGEVVGPYHGSHIDDKHIYVRIGKIVVAFPLSMPETSLLLKELSTLSKYQKIGILRIDDRVLIRKIP